MWNFGKGVLLLRLVLWAQTAQVPSCMLCRVWDVLGSSPGELSHGQGGFGFRECPAGSMAATGALPVQGSFTLLQLYSCLKWHCCKSLHKIKKPQIVHFELQHLAAAERFGPACLDSSFLALGSLLSCQHKHWCSSREPHQRHDLV